MLTHKQITTLLMMRQRNDSIFSPLPKELIKVVCDFGPNSDIAKALHHAAYARQEDVDALLGMLDENPSLLLQSGNVKTPGGDEWNQVTIYEFLLGAGDYPLARLVQDYFAKIERGEEERVRQYERYRPHLEGMRTQKPYDLSPIIELIKKAPAEEIKALLNKDMSGKTELCQAMLEFRKDWAPKILSKPSMHFNYASLKHALMIISDEWKNLYQASDDNYDKINFVWRQLVGFEMRRLPGVLRCMMAQGAGRNLLEARNTDWRSYVFKNIDSKTSFPITDSDDSPDGLGWDFMISALKGFSDSLTMDSSECYTMFLIGGPIGNQCRFFEEFKEFIEPRQFAPCEKLIQPRRAYRWKEAGDLIKPSESPNANRP